jgi:putative ABC transport system permease protein
MVSLRFALRHLIRHWRMNVVVLVGILMGTIFAASPPLLASVIAGGTLSQNLADVSPATRNLEVRGNIIPEEVMPQIQENMGDLLQGRMKIQQATIEGDFTFLVGGSEPRRVNEVLYFNLWSIDILEQTSDLLVGRLPEPGWTVDSREFEVVIGADAAQLMQLDVGDVLLPYQDDYRIRIVGVVAPTDPKSEYWWGDEYLLPFNILRESGLSQTDTVYISLLVHPETIPQVVPEYVSSWRILLDPEGITVRNADQVHDEVVNLQALISAEGATLETGLVRLFREYQDQQSLANTSLLLLTTQSFIAILYTLAMISTFTLDQSRSELASLASRGFSSSQISTIFAVEIAILAFGIALPLGPTIAFTGFNLWSSYSEVPTTGAIPTESWILVVVVAFFAWLALILPLYLSTRRAVFDWHRRRARPDQRPLWQQLTFDIALLVLGGLAYWQLNQAGSFLRRNAIEGGASATGAADPILLIGPTLFLFALGLIFLRLFPYLARIVARVSNGLRGLPLALGLNRLARMPSGPNRIVLLISLTVGLGLFATVFSNSVVGRQEQMANYLAGADLRLIQALSGEIAAEDQHSVGQLAGVDSASQVYRTRSRWGEGSGTVVDFLAVDPETFSSVSQFPPGISSVSMDPIMTVLEVSESGAIPIVLSHDAPPRNAAIGDRVEYRVGGRNYAFEVRGIIVDFPTLERPFVVAHLPSLEQQVDLASSALAVEGVRELWLKIDPLQHESLVAWFENQTKEEIGLASYQTSRLVDDAQARLRSFKAELVSRTANTAFQLNAIILGALSVGGFLLVQIFAARSRRVEFGILRAVGLSTVQLLGLVFLEGMILMILGLFLGVGVGYGLAIVMRPFLSLTLAQSLGGGAIDQVVIHLPTVGANLLVFVGFYILALVVLLAGLVLNDVHRTLRVIDE